MNSTLKIDRKTGHILFDRTEITPKTKLGDLSNDFVTGEEMLVSVMSKKVQCKFSKINIQHAGKSFELSLRFESENLVSAFISITDPEIPMKTQEEFYKSLKSIRELHEGWLKSQIGETPTALAKFKWGVVGVAQDKSDNIYVFLHNSNNTWAFSR